MGLAADARYPNAIRVLFKIIRQLVYVYTGGTVSDEEALLYFTIYQNPKLGLILWLLKEIKPLLNNQSDKDLLKMYYLLVLYYFAKFKTEDNKE